MRFNLLRRLIGLQRQVLDLVGDDGEPLAASPARLASIVAFNASSLVCDEMVVMTRVKPAISLLVLVKMRMMASVAFALSATSPDVFAFDCATR